MSNSALLLAVENRFRTEWALVNPTITVRYDGVSFTPPSPQASWVAIEVWDGDRDKASIGPGVQVRREFGTVFVDVYTEPDIGSLTARDLCDDITTIFRDVQVSGITFYEPSILRVGEKYYPGVQGTSGTAQWYMMKVAIPFKYDEFV
jgi:hypothetical protein